MCLRLTLPQFLVPGLLVGMAGILGAAPIQIDVPQVASLPVVDGIVEVGDLRGYTEIDLVRIGSMDRPQDPTTASVAVSREGIYFAFVCTDRMPQAIASRVMQENGAVFEDDSVQVFLAPTMEVDASNYVHVAVNSAGTKYTYDMRTERALEGVQASARTTGTGWEAEIFVPMRSFRGDLRVSRLWRANVARVRSPREGGRPERTAWVDPGVSLHNYRRFGFIRVLEPKGGAVATSTRTPAPLPELRPLSAVPIPQVATPVPAIVQLTPATQTPAPQLANRSVVITRLPSDARLVATREIMVATGKDLESVRVLLQSMPAVVATDMTEDRAEALQRTLSQLGIEATIRR